MHVRRFQQTALFSRGQNPHAQRLGEVKATTGLGRVIAFHVLFFNQPRDCQPEDRLRSVNRVSPGQRNTRRFANTATASHHLACHFRRQHIHRPPQNGNRHQWRTPHRVDIADGIGCCNAPKIKGVIHNRHEEVGGRNHATFFINGVNRRIIARSIAYP